MPDHSYLHLESGAHLGAYGLNSLPEPTEAQAKAGNYKLGRVSLHGLRIAIEQPRNTYRTGVDQKTGKRWVSRMAAHYGYISGTVGADGDGVDCFIGPVPQSEQAFIVNQFVGGRFDEHKVMLGFLDADDARRAYMDSYERGWKGLQSLIPLSISQLKWWITNGNMRRPVAAKQLPFEGFEDMDQKTAWGGDALPIGKTLDQVLYDLRRADAADGLLFDSAAVSDILEDADELMALDAMVVPFAKLERKLEQLRGIMERAGGAVKPVAMQVTEPFKLRGVANVAAIIELSDGQTVSIYFHNPDVTPGKMAPADEVISWRWLLNKRDITIAVAPERGVDLNPREVARRIMKLADKNSAAFQRANAKRTETMGRIDGLKTEISALEKELADTQHALEVAKVEAETKKADPVAEVDPTTPDGYAQVMANEALQLDYQDVLDSFFQGRGVEVRNALRGLGWAGDLDDKQLYMSRTFSKRVPGENGAESTLFTVIGDYKQVGAGANIVSINWDVLFARGYGEGSESGTVAKVVDDLTKTPEQIASAIDELLPKVAEVEDTYLPEGWTESAPGRMATNADPVSGGIVDRNGEGWFLVFNNDNIPGREGFATRKEAFEAFFTALSSAEASKVADEREKQDIAKVDYAESAARELGGVLSTWEQSDANEWQYANFAIDDKSLRIGASTGGVISINGHPFDPSGEMILSQQQVVVAMKAALGIDLAMPAGDPAPEAHDPAVVVDPVQAPATKADALPAIKAMRRFMSPAQLNAIGTGMRGEEGQFFIDKIIDMARLAETMPKTYDQDGKGDQAIAYLHYFVGGADWYITERDMDDEQLQAFGLADLGQGFPEVGYISIDEITKAGAELDLYFTPKTLAEIKGTSSAAEPAAEDPAKAADRALLQSVVDGTADVLSVDLDALEQAYLRNENDAEIAALFEKAVEVVLAVESKATEGV